MTEAIGKIAHTVAWKRGKQGFTSGTNIDWLVPIPGSECAHPLLPGP